jgi:hypothetical protein
MACKPGWCPIDTAADSSVCLNFFHSMNLNIIFIYL